MTTRNLTIATLALTLTAFAFAAPASADDSQQNEPAFASVSGPISQEHASQMTTADRVALLVSMGVERAHRLPPLFQARMIAELTTAYFNSIQRRIRDRAEAVDSK